MDEFEQLIKEKVESEQYDFKPEYWQNYVNKNGFASSLFSSVMGIVFLSVTMIASFSVAIRSSQPPIVDSTGFVENGGIPPAAPEAVVVTDTADNDFVNETTTTTTVTVKKSANHDEIIRHTDSLPLDKKPTTKSKPATQKHSWRVITINPDTIKDNDIPEWKNRSSELLP